MFQDMERRLSIGEYYPHGSSSRTDWTNSAFANAPAQDLSTQPPWDIRSVEKWIDWATAHVRAIDLYNREARSWGHHTLDPEFVSFWLSEIATNAGPSARPPKVVPLPDGGLQFEWLSEKSYFEIEAWRSGSIAYLIEASDTVSEGPITRENGSFDTVSWRHFFDQVRRASR